MPQSNKGQSFPQPTQLETHGPQFHQTSEQTGLCCTKASWSTTANSAHPSQLVGDELVLVGCVGLLVAEGLAVLLLVLLLLLFLPLQLRLPPRLALLVAQLLQFGRRQVVCNRSKVSIRNGDSRPLPVNNSPQGEKD